MPNALLDHYGEPILGYLSDEAVNEICINAFDDIWVEKDGRLARVTERFKSEDAFGEYLRQIAHSLDQELHESRAPILDARLPDGARVNAAIPPVAVGGAKATIRPYRRTSFTYEDLEELGTAPPGLRDILVDGIASGLNIVISGGTGSGKTAFLRAITQFFRPGERVIVIEDTNENIVPNHDHVVAFEAAKRVGEDDKIASVTMDTLIANALRCRPDRIVVGEIRKSPAAAAYLEAINTGHGGCITTTHANGAVDTLRRISNLLAWSTSSGISSETIDRLVSQNTDLIIHIRKVYEGLTYRRRVTEVLKIDVSGEQEFIIQSNPVARH